MKTLRPLLALPLLVSLAAPVEAEVVDRIVLRVNDRIATLAEYRIQVAERLGSLAAAAELDPVRRQELAARAPADTLSNLYEELLLLARADQLELRVGEAEVDSALQRTRERMGLTRDEDLRTALESAGLKLEGLRERLRRNLLTQRVVAQEIRERVELSDEELRRLYRERADELVIPEAVHLSEVIVRGEGETLPAAERRAAAMTAELAAGASLEDLARAGLEAGETTDLIDLGWVERGDLAPELEAAAWDLGAGEVSAPVASRGGYHVLRVEERREEALRPFEEVRELLLAQEQDRRLEEEYPDFLREIEDSSYVVIKAPPEAADFTGLGGETPTPPREEDAVGPGPEAG